MRTALVIVVNASCLCYMLRRHAFRLALVLRVVRAADAAWVALCLSLCVALLAAASALLVAASSLLAALLWLLAPSSGTSFFTKPSSCCIV